MIIYLLKRLLFSIILIVTRYLNNALLAINHVRGVKLLSPPPLINKYATGRVLLESFSGQQHGVCLKVHDDVTDDAPSIFITPARTRNIVQSRKPNRSKTSRMTCTQCTQCTHTRAYVLIYLYPAQPGVDPFRKLLL